MNKTTLIYFSKGFSLANRSLDIFLISLFFLLFGQLAYLFQESLIRNTLQLINFILLFFNIGFLMSIPAFLLWKQQNKSRLNYNTLWSTLTRNTKRMIIPTILFLILMMTFGIFLVFITVVNTQSANNQQLVDVIQNLINQLRIWNPLFILFGSIISLFVFTSIYFSVENNGFFTSAKKSVFFSFRNLHYVIVIMLIFTVTYSISVFLPVSSVNWGFLIRIIIGQYISLVITSSALYYYQSHLPVS